MAGKTYDAIDRRPMRGPVNDLLSSIFGEPGPARDAARAREAVAARIEADWRAVPLSEPMGLPLALVEHLEGRGVATAGDLDDALARPDCEAVAAELGVEVEAVHLLGAACLRSRRSFESGWRYSHGREGARCKNARPGQHAGKGAARA